MAKAKKKESLTPEERLQAALVPESEQPYKVPGNWCWTYLGCVSDVVTGGTPSKKHPEYYGGLFPFFKPTDLDFGRHVIEASEYLTDEGKMVSRIIPEQSTAVCCIGSIGKCGFLEVEGTTNQQINSAIPKFNSLFLYYYCNTHYFNKDLWSKASATTISIVNKSKMESCMFPLPPLTEQQRIVDRIESLFAKLDEAKQKAQDALDSFETRKAAILHKAFTGELTAQWRKEHGVGMESWKNLYLGDVFNLQAGKNISANQIQKEKNEKYKYPCFGGNGIRGYVKNFNREGNHPIIGRQGALCGNINVAQGQFYATEHAVVVDYKLDVITTWAVHYLRFLNLNQYATATAQPGLAVSNIIKVPIKYVPYDEQEEIARILDDLLAKEQQAKEAVEAVLEQIDLIKKSILARAFRGELSTNDPAEESAVELLKQVL